MWIKNLWIEPTAIITITLFIFVSLVGISLCIHYAQKAITKEAKKQINKTLDNVKTNLEQDLRMDLSSPNGDQKTAR